MMSMTGFGRATAQLEGQSFRLELRSVNNRHLDVRVHAPWHDAELEGAIRERLRSRLARGRVDVTISAGDADADAPIALNVVLAQRLADVLHQLAGVLRCDVQTAARMLPPQPNLLAASTVAADPAGARAAVDRCLEQALDGLATMRAQEGAALQRDLERHVARLTEIAAEVTTLTDEAPKRRQERMRQRLDRLAADVDPERLAQELALLADRCDVSEELTRIDSHLQQLRQMFVAAEPIGRKIEFMLQEVNRELNTIASKSNDAKIAGLIVDGKGSVEKMREQAQNVE